MHKRHILLPLFAVLIFAGTGTGPVYAQQDPNLPRFLRSPNAGIQNRGVGRPEGSRFLNQNRGRELQSIRPPSSQGQQRAIQGIRPGGGALGPMKTGMSGAAGNGSAGGLKSMSAGQGAAAGLQSIRPPSSQGQSLREKRGLQSSASAAGGAGDVKRSMRQARQSESFLSKVSNSVRNLFNGNKKGDSGSKP